MGGGATAAAGRLGGGTAFGGGGGGGGSGRSRGGEKPRLSTPPGAGDCAGVGAAGDAAATVGSTVAGRALSDDDPNRDEPKLGVWPDLNAAVESEPFASKPDGTSSMASPTYSSEPDVSSTHGIQRHAKNSEMNFGAAIRRAPTPERYTRPAGSSRAGPSAREALRPALARKPRLGRKKCPPGSSSNVVLAKLGDGS